MTKNNKYKFSWKFTPENDGSFVAPSADNMPPLYFPLMNSFGMKSFVTPDLKGDIVSSFNNYLTVATVTEELHRNISSRNFWIKIKDKNPWSATGNSVFQKAQKWTDNTDNYSIKGKIGAFVTNRKNEELGLESEITVFVPEIDDFIEIVNLKVKNLSNHKINFSGTYAIPLFGRSADNVRDHRQVTTMFQENFIENHGVRIKPKIEHNEKGHTQNKTNYVVLGFDQNSKAPEDIWIRLHDFIGMGGSLDNPQAIFENSKPPKLTQNQMNASEAIAAFRFEEKTLEPNETAEFIIIHGITEDLDDLKKWRKNFNTPKKIDALLNNTLNFWNDKVNTVSFKTADNNYDNWVKWISFQVKCRQIFGNSYLPDFGYGRGGRGWRDLWQDLLSIFLVDAESAKNEMLNNFKGIRIDGTNATIIGTNPGEFLADRNNIPRTWSDHAAWPVFILNFYINQTGDFDILFNQITYWKDRFSHRNQKINENWSDENGNSQTDKTAQIYTGTLFEHILIQQLSSFFNVGEHNILKLEGADWNDTYDMASDRGESVCFHSFYSYNFNILANILTHLQKNGTNEIEILEEMLILLDNIDENSNVDYNSPKYKNELLQKYFNAVEGNISANKIKISISKLIEDLNIKSNHIAETIRNQEWITTKEGYKFFNGHYDNIGKAIGGNHSDGVKMDLTSQVMPIICNIADNQKASETYKSIKAILKDNESPAIRLTTEFKHVNLNIGRITGFVYGHKEHGSKWMQQNIMLAYGLYKQGLVEQGFEVMEDVYKISNNKNIAQIFPGVPSYFNTENKGAYAYLTGSSSWFLLTLTTQVFGVRGEKGNLCINPKLTKQQFDKNGEASISLNFQNKRLNITYQNSEKLNFDEYKINEILVNNNKIKFNNQNRNLTVIDKDTLNQKTNCIKVILSK